MTPKKNESALKKKIKEMKKTSKGNAILKLIGWVIFFIGLFIFCVIASLITKNRPLENKPITEAPKPEVKEPINDTPSESNTFNDLIKNLKNSNYTYNYEITSNGIKYVFKGTRKDNTEDGYKESSNGIVKYHIENGYIYEELMDNRVLIDTLYENLESKFLNISSLVETLDELNIEISAEDTYKATDEKNNYIISISNNFIENIVITSSSYEYNLNFTKLGVE